ncbi:MAG: hypothetical protein AB7O24_20845 [Kofleriaceae bacterium]
MPRIHLPLVLWLTTMACGTQLATDPGLEDLAVARVAPDTIIPGSKLVIQGASFVDSLWGETELHLQGRAGGAAIDVAWSATFVDFNTLTVAVDAEMIGQLGGDSDFTGTATVEVLSAADGNVYSSTPLNVTLSVREQLTPTANSIASGGVIFVNDKIEVTGSDFLLGGDEGVTVAKVAGCYMLTSGGGCTPVAEREIPMIPVDPLDRTKAEFAFSPSIAGIKPGSFTGTVTVINQQQAASPKSAAAKDVTYDLVSSEIFSIDPPVASLGQYVFVRGGGFIGGEPQAATELELKGNLTVNSESGTTTNPVTLRLLPDYVEGRLIRYVLNTQDNLGEAVDLRDQTGKFVGTATPLISYDGEFVIGKAKSITLDIAPVKQVVYLDFQPTYVEALRDFGLRAVDSKIRERILQICRDTYEGVNIEFRTEPVTDFALYEDVALVGVDPNNKGLFGYDNSPGKDNNNVRLHDRLGGVNAETQQDGYDGYGGVFLRSLMGFSKHPGSFAESVPGADPEFDKTFDPFRADQGGTPVSSADLAGGIPSLTDGASCPASDRKAKLACAIYVLGNLVGGTLAHEIGHSLGLANPNQEGFHNSSDQPNRLMDSGGDRPFLERAVLQSRGPGVFCDEEYDYLRRILPKDVPPPDVERPGCY